MRVTTQPFAAGLELLERERELAAVEGLIGAVGGGRLLAIEGPPGIGKTACGGQSRARRVAAAVIALRATNTRGEEAQPTSDTTSDTTSDAVPEPAKA